jgi:hypothetical protein
MNTRSLTLLLAVALPLPAEVFAARNSADLQPPQVRQLAVTKAERLARRPAPAPLPADLVSPFDPVDFDKPDPADAAAVAAANAAGASAARKTTGAAPAQRTAPLSDRETLEKLAAQLAPTGMIMLRGSPRLVISNKPFEVGTRFTATYNNQDYELELVAIDRTTFTLRYRGEDITRPIKPVR